MGDTKYPIDLTENEREQLEAITSYGRHSAQKITRARILLKADEGESDSAIAEALDCSRSTAWRTRKKFHERDRLEAIERKKPDREYETKLDGRDEAYLIRLACSEPPEGRSRWTLRVLADKLADLEETDVESVSHETVRQTLKKTNSSPTAPNNG
jgi:transposase